MTVHKMSPDNAKKGVKVLEFVSPHKLNGKSNCCLQLPEGKA